MADEAALDVFREAWYAAGGKAAATAELRRRLNESGGDVPVTAALSRLDVCMHQMEAALGLLLPSLRPTR